jgi:branched-chain amino acid transport system permease protein
MARLMGNHPGLKRLAYVGVAVVLLVLPFIVDAVLGRTWVRIVDVALLYVMLALGLNIVVGFAGLLDLGYIAFFAVGAYSYALLASPQFDIHASFLVLLPLGAFLAAVFGVLLGAPTLNNLNRPVNITNGPLGITLIDPISLGEVSLSKTYALGPLSLSPVHSYYYVFLLCALVSIVISVRLEDSRIGRAWIAIREDEQAAKAMGINTRNVKLLAFAMGATFGGVAGGLFASFQGFISPESFTLLESIMVLCMVVLGGMGNVGGVVLGAALLTALPEALRYVGPLQQTWFGHVFVDPSDLRMLMFGLALVLMMLFRPAGLWPSKIRKRELATAAE